MDLVPTTELKAVNALLSGIGETPTNSLEDTGVVDVVLALQTLEFVSRNVQEKGWHWNTMESYKLPRTTAGEVLVPETTLKVDTVGPDQCKPAVQRGTRMFNKATNTFKFPADLIVDIVEFLAFEELPQAARTYITYGALRKFQEDRLGSSTLSEFQQKDEQLAWQQLLAAESEILDASIFDSWDVARVLAR